jgi:DNA-binding PadR family transcriptional regulator
MTTKSKPHDSRVFPPLKPDLFHILLALSEDDLHGYGIMKAVEENTEGRILLEPSPLYRRLKRFLESGIVAEGEGGSSAGTGDPRRRYYRLTSLGRRVLAAEAARLVELAESSRVRKLAASAGRVP